MNVWNKNAFNHIGKELVQHVYYIASRINHTCEPNAFQPFTPDGTIILKSTQSIKRGKEICFDYGCYHGSAKTRRGVLMDKFIFGYQYKGYDTKKRLAEEIIVRLPTSQQARDSPTALVIE